MSGKESMLYGLIFDVDGVIADTEKVNARASIKVFEDRYGLKGVRPEDFAAGLGRGAEAYMRAAATVHGLWLSDEEVRAAAEERQRNFLDMLAKEPLPPFPGVVELIEEAMRKAEWKVGIATSSSREKSEAVLRSAGIPCEKMVYVTGSDVKNKKPDPALFLTAARRMGVEPSRSVVIEDAPNGVQAAKAGGFTCVAVTTTSSKEALSEADVVVDSLDELSLERLKSLVDRGGNTRKTPR